MVDLQPNKHKPGSAVAQTWGRNIKARRDLLRWNQEFLSDRSGVPQQTISKIENGRFTPSLDMLLDLARGLGANPAELYHWPTLGELAVA